MAIARRVQVLYFSMELTDAQLFFPVPFLLETVETIMFLFPPLLSGGPVLIHDTLLTNIGNPGIRLVPASTWHGICLPLPWCQLLRHSQRL
jgi:hypothetical protein